MQIPIITQQQKPGKAKRVAKSEPSKDCKLWTDEEVDRLLKACAQIEDGSDDRWEKISKLVGGEKTPNQCCKKS